MYEHQFKDKKTCEDYRKERSSYITTRKDNDGKDETIMTTYSAGCIKSEPVVKVIKKGKIEIKKD